VERVDVSFSELCAGNAYEKKESYCQDRIKETRKEGIRPEFG